MEMKNKKGPPLAHAVQPLGEQGCGLLLASFAQMKQYVGPAQLLPGSTLQRQGQAGKVQCNLFSPSGAVIKKINKNVQNLH